MIQLYIKLTQCTACYVFDDVIAKHIVHDLCTCSTRLHNVQCTIYFTVKPSTLLDWVYNTENDASDIVGFCPELLL